MPSYVKPWIGTNYSRRSQHQVRLLIMGESAYDWEENYRIRTASASQIIRWYWKKGQYGKSRFPRNLIKLFLAPDQMDPKNLEHLWNSGLRQLCAGKSTPEAPGESDQHSFTRPKAWSAVALLSCPATPRTFRTSPTQGVSFMSLSVGQRIVSCWLSRGLVQAHYLSSKLPRASQHRRQRRGSVGRC